MGVLHAIRIALTPDCALALRPGGSSSAAGCKLRQPFLSPCAAPPDVLLLSRVKAGEHRFASLGPPRRNTLRAPECLWNTAFNHRINNPQRARAPGLVDYRCPASTRASTGSRCARAHVRAMFRKQWSLWSEAVIGCASNLRDKGAQHEFIVPLRKLVLETAVALHIYTRGLTVGTSVRSRMGPPTYRPRTSIGKRGRIYAHRTKTV